MSEPPGSQPGPSSDSRSAETAVRLADALAGSMDSRFRIPGTRIRFGWDAIIGILPGIGDTVTSLIGLSTVAAAHRLGASGWTIARMLANLGIDWLIGLVPVLGFPLDTLYKAHSRNAALLRRELDRISAEHDVPPGQPGRQTRAG